MSKAQSVICLTLVWLLLSPMSFAQNLVASNSYSIAGLKNTLPVDEKNKITLIEHAKTINEKVALKGKKRLDRKVKKMQVRLKQGVN